MSAFTDVAIIGAGPYGLSIAAHLGARGIEFRIFGKPMESWQTRMPKGMFLKSEGFASSLFEPSGCFTLQRFCSESEVPYEAIDFPVPLETFVAYGLAFQRRFVSNLDERMVAAVDRATDHFLLRLDDGAEITARRVVVAVGVTYFSHVPAAFGHLSREVVSHSSDHHDLSRFRGVDVTVIGGGASALDSAALLHDGGAAVRLVTRRSALSFNPPGSYRQWQQWYPWYPMSGLGRGWRNQFYERAPMLFRRLPRGTRTWIVHTTLGPAGGYTVKDRVDQLPQLLGHTIRCVSFRDRRVRLQLLGPDGEENALSTEHLMAGTGFRVDLRRLTFLSSELRRQVKSIGFVPILSSDFQSSV
ncbi:MAG: NAD(P)/FAD-dependent oxidoreductase, partial [Acetobacteraceae bacterium]|nr:NAD(P)/FAD-dependent oxidoreductase [Acetobacteraceae bacterium]